MKKEYMKPQMEAIVITIGKQLLAGSAVTIIDGEFEYGGAGSEEGRAPELFNDEDSWY